MNGRKAKRLRRESAKQTALENEVKKELERRGQNTRASMKNTPCPDGYHVGQWGGAEPCVFFRVILAKILPVPEKPMAWQNAFVGEERQIIEIKHKDYTFYIDNATGQGVFKLTTGMGSPSIGHASLNEFEYISDVPKDQWQQPDKALWQRDNDIVDEYQKITDPEQFKRLQALRASIKSRK